MNDLTTKEPQTFEQMREQAAILLKSGFLPKAIDTPEKAIAIVMIGRELGLGMMISLRELNVIQGKPCSSSQLLLGQCFKTGEVDQAYFEKQTPTEVVYVLTRKGSPPHKVTWNIERAKGLGLLERDNWKKQPQTMLSWRAISEAARMKFPDAICGLYIEDEAEDIITTQAATDLVVEMPRAKTVEVIQEPAPAPPERAEELPAAIGTEVVDDNPCPTGYKKLKAVADGKCKGCGEAYKKDAEVVYSTSKGVRHFDCA